MSSGARPPRATDATVRVPAAWMQSTIIQTSDALATGRRMLLPMLPRSAFHENGCADAPLTTTPVTPPASAARISAPRLPGSCTSMATRVNPFRVFQTAVASIGVRRAIATMPEGDRTGLMAAKTRSGALTTGTPAASSARATSASSVSSVSLDAATATDSKSSRAACASRTRCTPSSSSRAPFASASLASSRYVRTIGLSRLEIVFINLRLDW